jgi:hypothetical protein
VDVNVNVNVFLLLLGALCNGVACGGDDGQSGSGQSGSGGSAVQTGSGGASAASGGNSGSANTGSGGVNHAGGSGGVPAITGSGGASADGGSGGGNANAADAGAPLADSGLMEPKLPRVDSVDADGPFDTMQDLASGPSGDSGVFYPIDLGRDGLLHPIFLWGCGGSSTPSQYVDHMNRIASHGFVAVADVTTTAADGAPLKASLEWIIAENERTGSVFFHKLDLTQIAAGGHSIGSVNAFELGPDPRIKTTIHVAGGSLDNDGASALKLTHPTAYICSEQDLFGNVEKAEADYAVTNVPVFFTVITGSDHVAAARDGLPAIVAWLRWQIGGEADRAAMFLEPDGEFTTGKFVSQHKNW